MSKFFVGLVLFLGAVAALISIVVLLMAVAVWLTDWIEARREARALSARTDTRSIPAADRFAHHQRRFEG